jgi:hypothetical protein
LEIEKAESRNQSEETSLNEHLRLYRQGEEIELAKMERKYKTIFVNPTELRSETIIQALIVLKRVYDYNGKEEGGKNRYD